MIAPKKAAEIVVNSESNLPVYVGIRGVQKFCFKDGENIQMELSVNIRAIRKDTTEEDYVPVNISVVSIDLNENEFVKEISPTDVNGEKISKNMISNMRNILKSIQIAETDNSDLFYFLEDDYIHTKDAITEMLFTYEKISSQLNKEIFLCPADYPYLYSTIENTKLFFGNMRHWRTVNETLITFLTSKKMIIKYLDKFKLMGSKRHHPMELILHKIYEKEYCFSPIPSLAMHATNINTIYGLPPNFDWKKIWEENTP